MTTITDRIAELRRLLLKATPGPWAFANWMSGDRPSSITSLHRPGQAEAVAICPRYKADKFRQVDARLIIAAVNALPALLEVAEAAERMREGERLMEEIPLVPHEGEAVRKTVAKFRAKLDAALSKLTEEDSRG